MKADTVAFLVWSGLGPNSRQPRASSSRSLLRLQAGAASHENEPPVGSREQKQSASLKYEAAKELPAGANENASPPANHKITPTNGVSPRISLQELTGRTGRLLRSQRNGSAGGAPAACWDQGAAKVPSAPAAAAWLAKRRAILQEPVSVSALVEDVIPGGVRHNGTNQVRNHATDENAASRANCSQHEAPTAAAAYRESLSGSVVVQNSPFREVVVIFGKRLVRDQITYEYAVRILTLVRHMVTGRIKPSAVCFTGGRDHPDSLVSEAVAGYLFFRHVCEEFSISLDSVAIILEEQHLNARDCMSSILTQLGEQLVGSHFTFVSSDYHLIRIREVEAAAPNLSLLAPLRKLRGTVSYAYTTYPFALSKNAAVALAGRAIVIAAELGIMIVALRSYIEERGLFQRDVFRRFQEATIELGNLCEKCSAALQVQIPTASSTTDDIVFTQDIRLVGEVIESAYFELRQVIRVLEQWVLEKSPLSRMELQNILQQITIVEQRIRSSLDPDRPLTAMEWNHLPLVFLAPVLGPGFEQHSLSGDPGTQPWIPTSPAGATPAPTTATVTSSVHGSTIAPATAAYATSRTESALSSAPAANRNATTTTDSSWESSSFVSPSSSMTTSAAVAAEHAAAAAAAAWHLRKPSASPLNGAGARLRHFASIVAEASQAIFHEVLRPEYHEEKARRISEENRRRRRQAAAESGPGLSPAKLRAHRESHAASGTANRRSARTTAASRPANGHVPNGTSAYHEPKPPASGRETDADTTTSDRFTDKRTAT
jgi:hypothetical protein